MNTEEIKQFKNSGKALQKSIFDNKVAKKFNITDVPLEFCLSQGELAEAFDSWRKSKEDVGEELADVVIYLYGLAAILEVDLSNEVIKKVGKNAKRKYKVKNGVRVKVE